ncbi:porin [Vibrio rarus]|uniref:porin n=1 Tax=Vibrio rarus TaxID=413403 RepID=UPI0021C430A5|nr:porin [Vibrio rarus]
MKKTLLALAVASLAATSVNAAEIYKAENASVDFYGQLRTELKGSDDSISLEDGAQDGKVTLGAGSSRMGITADYTITDGLGIMGLVELGVGSGDVNVRQHILGVVTDFGTLKFGEQWTVSDDIYGADYSYFFGGSALGYSNVSGASHDSLIKYNLDLENFFVAANYGLNEDDSNQDLMEVFVGGNVAGLDLHVGFGQVKDNTPDEDNNKFPELKDTYYQGTVAYDFGGASIGFTYYNTKIEVENQSAKINGYSLAGTFDWADNATAYTGFEYTDQELTGLVEAALPAQFKEDDTSTVIYVGTDYHFNSFTRLYVEAAYQDGRTLGFTNKASDEFVGVAVVDGGFSWGVGARVYW